MIGDRIGVIINLLTDDVRGRDLNRPFLIFIFIWITRVKNVILSFNFC